MGEIPQLNQFGSNLYSWAHYFVLFHLLPCNFYTKFCLSVSQSDDTFVGALSNWHQVHLNLFLKNRHVHCTIIWPLANWVAYIITQLNDYWHQSKGAIL